MIICSKWKRCADHLEKGDSVSGAFLSKVRESQYVLRGSADTLCVFYTHLHNFRRFHACTTNGPTVYKAGDTNGWWGMETNARRLGCRFIGRKILDLLISLVRHVGIRFIADRNLPRSMHASAIPYSWADLFKPEPWNFGEAQIALFFKLIH